MIPGKETFASFAAGGSNLILAIYSSKCNPMTGHARKLIAYRSIDVAHSASSRHQDVGWRPDVLWVHTPGHHLVATT